MDEGTSNRSTSSSASSLSVEGIGADRGGVGGLSGVLITRYSLFGGGGGGVIGLLDEAVLTAGGDISSKPGRRIAINILLAVELELVPLFPSTNCTLSARSGPVSIRPLRLCLPGCLGTASGKLTGISCSCRCDYAMPSNWSYIRDSCTRNRDASSGARRLRIWSSWKLR